MKLRTKALLNHLNMFTDYMVSEVIHITARGSQSSQQVTLHQQVTHLISIVSKMIVISTQPLFIFQDWITFLTKLTALNTNNISNRP